MATDVGVLQLEIQDNSKQAGGGIEKLADALDRIKTIISGGGEDGLGLAKINTQLKNFAQIVNRQKTTSTVIKNLTAFGNAMEKLSKASGSLNIDPNESLKKLNESIGSGAGLKAAASAMNAYAKAVAAIKVAYGSSASARSVDAATLSTEEWREKHPNLIPYKPQFFGGRGTKKSEGQMNMFETVPGLEKVESVIQTAASASEKMRDKVVEVKNEASESGMSSVTAAFNSIDASIRNATDDLAKFGSFYSKIFGGSFSDMHGSAPNNMALSTYVAPPWQPNWTYYDPSVVAGWQPGFQMQGSPYTWQPGFQMMGDAYSNENMSLSTEVANMSIVPYEPWMDLLKDASGQAENSEQEIAEAFERILAANAENARIAEQVRAQQEAHFYGRDGSFGESTSQGAEEASGHVDTLKEKLLDLKWLLGDLASRGRSAFDGIKTGINKLFKPLTKLISKFGQIAKYRALRAVLKHITSGFTEGVENVYHYSKLVGTELAPAMDAAATSLQQMKNSIGAAVAPVIQALVPVLQNVVNWFINLINYANQFFALLNGQNSWTRALPESAEAYEKSAKSAKNASKATKDLLADWDELNIIQSQNSGGSGSKSGHTDEEYKNMFEQVNEFDQKVKDAIAFIDEHLGGIPGLLKKAAAILLGWKFSKAFSGLLGALGKIVAGGVLVSIGLDLTWAGAYSAGTKGYFDSGDILKTIIGGLATALGGSLITTALGIGGVWGFGIGLMAAAVVTIVGFCQGEKDLADKNKWGGLTMTQEQIEQFVRKQFTFEVDAEIDVIDAHIHDTDAAKDQVREAVTKFENSLTDAEKVVADINTTSAAEKVAAVKQAALDAQDAINALQKLIDANEKGLSFVLTNFTFRNEAGEDITSDLLASIQSSNTTLSEYMTGIGEKLAQLMLDGEKSGWKNGEMEAALELMASQKRIYDRAETMQEKMKFETQAEAAVKNVVDRDTALKIYQEQQTKLKEYEDKVKELVQKEADNLSYLASLAESAAIEAGYDPLTGTGTEIGMKLHQTAEDYKADAVKLLGGLQNAVDEKLKETKEKMAKEWAETLRVVYGADFDKTAETLIKSGSIFNIDWSKGLFADTTSWNAINDKSIQEAADSLRSFLLRELINADNDYSGLVSYYVNDLGGNIWDLMTEEARQMIAQKILTHSDNSGNAYQIFKSMFGLDEETAKKYIDPMYQDIWADLNKEVEQTPPLELPMEAEITISNMDQMKADIEEAMKDAQLTTEEFLDIMDKNHYNFELYDQAMKELQYNLDEEGYNIGKRTAVGYIANTGYSTDGNMSRKFVDTGAPTQYEQENTVANGVAKGTKEGNEDQNTILTDIRDFVRIIRDKDWTININPTSDWGAHNAKSNAQFANATGNDYP